MKQEDKELLLKDLCARLPYGIKCKIAHSYKYKATQDVVTLTDISHISPECYFEESDEFEKIENVKPYLCPMSSMTNEEYEDYISFDAYTHLNDGSEVPCMLQIDWLNTHHFDYRGLIEKGLALEAPEGMYK